MGNAANEGKAPARAVNVSARPARELAAMPRPKAGEGGPRRRVGVRADSPS